MKQLSLAINCITSIFVSLFLTTVVALPDQAIAQSAIPLKVLNEVVFPIEVFDDGTLTKVKNGVASPGKKVSININFSANPENVASIELSLFNVMYERQASFQVNNGPKIPLTPNTVTVMSPWDQLSWVGQRMDVGRFVKVRIPVEKIPLSHSNRIHFIFNETNGTSSGFRVVDLKFVLANGAYVPSPGFTKDQPLAWQAPSNDPKAVARGLALWHDKPLKQSPNNPIFIKGNCADCHGGGFKTIGPDGKITYAKSGKDLQKFAFSNESIITRAKFHGLTTKEATDIASYIRSLSEIPNGRPWSAYQPGNRGAFMLTDRAPEDFAVGMGIEAVVSDEVMRNQLMAVVTDERLPIDTRLVYLDIRNINASINLPDVFEWWAHQAPEEVAPENDKIFQLFQKREQLLRDFAESHPTLRDKPLPPSKGVANPSDGSEELLANLTSRINNFHSGFFNIQRTFYPVFALNALDAERAHGARLASFINRWDILRPIERSGVTIGGTVASHNVPSNPSFLASPRFVTLPWRKEDLSPFRFDRAQAPTVISALSWDYLHLVQESVAEAIVDGNPIAINASVNYEFGYRLNAFSEAYNSGFFKNAGPFYATFLQAMKIQSHGKHWSEFVRAIPAGYLRFLLIGQQNLPNSKLKIFDPTEAKMIARAGVHYFFQSLKQFSDAELLAANTIKTDRGQFSVTINSLDPKLVNSPNNCSSNRVVLWGKYYPAYNTPVGLLNCLEVQLNALGVNLEPGSEAMKQRNRILKLGS